MIAHVDADSFFASVLQRLHPHLKGKPLLAMGMGGGFVIAASYEAKAKGVRTGTPLKEAMKLCPNAVQMPSDFRETAVASEQIEAVLQNVCPFIEQMSIDEWYMDLASLVGGIPKDAQAWAKNLQQEVLRQTSLSVSIGVGPSKLLAKIAGEYRKPAGVTAIGMNDLEWFLKDRPAPAIPGIGSKREVHTKAHGWATAWDIATAPRHTIKDLFGKSGTDMQRELLGECLSPVSTETGPQKSISRTRSFRATRDEGILWAHILRHLSYCVFKMRRQGMMAKGISVWLRDGEYRHGGFNATLTRPLDTEAYLTPFIRRCFQKTYDPKRAYTQAGMALWNLTPNGSVQYSLFDAAENVERDEGLQQSLDSIRKRYGRDVITLGAALPVNKKLKPELGYSVLE